VAQAQTPIHHGTVQQALVLVVLLAAVAVVLVMMVMVLEAQVAQAVEEMEEETHNLQQTELLILAAVLVELIT
jgi:hypothetical protein